ncbi:MAG: type III secretion system export apparatus subunit SctU [Verrucomicrobiales bacterium]|nr:type III secretion system export apparatus subunit SctU [Verrucomicrobiales bacterium]
MSEKTEEPTPKKLRDAREKGQVAMSKDVVSTVLLALLCAYLGITWNKHVGQLRELILLPTAFYTTDFRSALGTVMDGVLAETIRISLPVLAVAVAGAIIGGYVQIGALFTLEPLKPELKKLNPIEGAKKIFNMKSLFELLKSTLKVIIIGAVIYYVVRASIEPLMKIPYSGIPGIMAALSTILFRLVLYTMFAYIALAAADFAFQKFQHIKQLRMSKDEVKREYKESEGDPEIKGKRKQLHREILEDNTLQNTRKATVLVTNPTHRAVALVYEAGVTSLPVVVAKGGDALARRMIGVARAAGIPIMENVPLARALYDRVSLHGHVPGELLEPVAQVLLWVQTLGEAGERAIEAARIETGGESDGWVRI